MTTAAPDLAAVPRRRRILIPIAVVAALVAAFLVFMAVTGSDDEKSQVKGTSALPFSLKYPDGWTSVPKDELATLPGKPLAVIRQKEGKGFVVLRAEGRAPKSFGTFATDLSKESRSPRAGLP